DPQSTALGPRFRGDERRNDALIHPLISVLAGVYHRAGLPGPVGEDRLRRESSPVARMSAATCGTRRPRISLALIRATAYSQSCRASGSEARDPYAVASREGAEYGSPPSRGRRKELTPVARLCEATCGTRRPRISLALIRATAYSQSSRASGSEARDPYAVASREGAEYGSRLRGDDGKNSLP